MTPYLVNLNLLLAIFIGANCLQSQVSGKSETERESKSLCRYRDGKMLDPKVFALVTCRDCYIFMPNTQFKPRNSPLITSETNGSPSNDKDQKLHKKNMMDIHKTEKWSKTKLNREILQNPEKTHESIANESDPNSQLLSSFIDSHAIKLWKDCCKSAEECCQKMISATNDNSVDRRSKNNAFTEIESSQCKVAKENEDSENDDVTDSLESSCPPTWDGWQCWENGGRPGYTEYIECPKYIYFKTSSIESNGACGVYKEYAEKTCNCDGTWYKKPPKNPITVIQNNTTGNGPKLMLSRSKRIGQEWTNYMNCKKNHLKELETKELLEQGLYIASLIALTPAIIIFFSYKILRVPRIAIHKNLFASLILNGISMVMFINLVLIPYLRKNENASKKEFGGTLMEQNTFGCRWLLMQTMYFRLTNFSWMFCEGYYLHRLLANTFEEQRSLVFMLVVGWGFPAIVCLLYALLRATIPGNDTMCWVLPAYSGWIEWIYIASGLICIVANLLFFINIFRILMTKLRAPQSNEPVHYRKAVRATIVLLPLFGLDWLLTVYRPSNSDGGGCIWPILHRYLIVILSGARGLMVSIVFCYRNGEICILLNQTYSKYREYLPSYFQSRGDNRGHNTFQMSEYKRQAETCVTQIPECTPLAPAVANDPKDVAAPIIKNDKNGSRLSPSKDSTIESVPADKLLENQDP